MLERVKVFENFLKSWLQNCCIAVESINLRNVSTLISKIVVNFAE